MSPPRGWSWSNSKGFLFFLFRLMSDIDFSSSFSVCLLPPTPSLWKAEDSLSLKAVSAVMDGLTDAAWAPDGKSFRSWCVYFSDERGRVNSRLKQYVRLSFAVWTPGDPRWKWAPDAHSHPGTGISFALSLYLKHQMNQNELKTAGELRGEEAESFLLFLSWKWMLMLSFGPLGQSLVWILDT